MNGYKFQSLPNQTSPLRLNVGCGRQNHPDWVNLDLVPVPGKVLACDIRRGLPFPEGTFESVYHSHLLEHLTPEQGSALVAECFRVLAPGGILRIVVPDLERIAELYLQHLRRAWQGIPSAAADYEWMKLELLDQLVRSTSGGRMGPSMIAAGRSNCSFVLERIGHEIHSCTGEADEGGGTAAWPLARGALRDGLARMRTRIARLVVRWLLGREGVTALEEGLFRNSGEIHRWMYDRFSLKKLCEDAGFHSFTVCRADESRIADFNAYRLDVSGGQVRKPDSLFVECVKPAQASVRGVLRAAA